MLSAVILSMGDCESSVKAVVVMRAGTEPGFDGDTKARPELGCSPSAGEESLRLVLLFLVLGVVVGSSDSSSSVVLPC